MSTSIMRQALELGINKIRCSLTGAVIATIDDEQMLKSIQFEQIHNPLGEDSEILDSLTMRFIIQSSRPAPHLSFHRNADSYQVLRGNDPKSLFALLAGRILFENTTDRRIHGTSELAKSKLFWLVDLWDSINTPLSDSILDTLDRMITIDAIHSSRNCLYSNDTRNYAAQLRDSFNLPMLHDFIETVEADGFFRLTTMPRAPQGNPNAINTLLAMNGITPKHIVDMEEETFKKAEKARTLVNAINAQNAGKSGSVKVNHGFKVMTNLRDITGALPAKLEERYQAESELLAAKKALKDINKPKKAATKKPASNRFANFDLDSLFGSEKVEF